MLKFWVILFSFEIVKLFFFLVREIILGSFTEKVSVVFLYLKNEVGL